MANTKDERRGLTVLQIKFLEIKDKRYDVVDIPGLYIRVFPNGTKIWRISKSIGGKRVVKSIGAFPEVSISDARTALRKCVEAGSLNHANSANTFEKIANGYIDVKKARIKHWKDIEERVNKYLMPDLKKILWEKLTPVMLLDVIHKNVPLNLKTTKMRLCYYLQAMEKYAVNMGLADSYHLQSLVSAVPKYIPVHMASITPDKLPVFMRSVYIKGYVPYLKEHYQWKYEYWTPFLVGLFTLVRPKEYLSLKWEYVDFEKKVITIPAENMKMKRTHEIPMSTQLEALLSDMNQETEYLFPQAKNGTPLAFHEFNVRFCYIFNKASEDCGLKVVPHGIRSIGRTWMSENGVDFEVAEHCIAHNVGDATVQAYNRTTQLAKRKVVMQKWADFVEECFAKSKIDEIDEIAI